MKEDKDIMKGWIASKIDPDSLVQKIMLLVGFLFILLVVMTGVLELARILTK